MFKFYKCKFIDYQKIWLRERIENFVVIHYNTKWTLDQYVYQFMLLYEKENRDQVIEIFKTVLNQYSIS